jgi:hypothetical protein
MSRRLMLGKGSGDREVSRNFILAIPKEGVRGGTWFPHGSDPQGSDA